MPYCKPLLRSSNELCFSDEIRLAQRKAELAYSPVKIASYGSHTWSSSVRKAPPLSPLSLWTRRFFALLVIANYLLVLFDLTYIPWRSFWLHGDLHVSRVKVNLPFVPQVTQLYDPIKGISSHRETARYLRTFDQLKTALATGASEARIESGLATLRVLSIDMIEEDPFAAVGKSGTLEKIKNELREYQGLDSAKQSFRQFWSPKNFTPGEQAKALAFFETQVLPLLETNYYRSISENGKPADRFWRLDFWFQIIFLIELIGHLLLIRRRHPSLRWREVLLWRWYDLPLFLPFLRWLRIMPLLVRLQGSRIVDLEPLRSQASRGFIGLFAGELLEIITVQTINQIQYSVRQGELRSLLRLVRDPYVDLNDTNEIEVLARRFSEILVYRVLPQVRPDLEAVLQYNLLYTIQQLPAYQTLQNLPGFNTVPNRLTQQLASGVTQALTRASQGTYDTLAIRDPAAAELTEQLVRNFTLALSEALSEQNTLSEIQTLICDLLEEVKVNYVSRIAESDFEDVLEETQQLQRRFSTYQPESLM